MARPAPNQRTSLKAMTQTSEPRQDQSVKAIRDGLALRLRDVADLVTVALDQLLPRADGPE
jgi:hypothetical protein